MDEQLANDLLQGLAELLKIAKYKMDEDFSRKMDYSYRQVLLVDADCRRDKQRAIIKGMQELDVIILELEHEYEKIKRLSGVQCINAMDSYITELKKYKKGLFQEKNKFR